MLKRYYLLTATACILLTGATIDAATYDISTDSVYQHIIVLASDSLEGREVGEPGELKAAAYIQSIFKSLGLEPKGDPDSYLQAFDFVKKVDFGPGNSLTLNDTELRLPDEFQPMLQSAMVSFDFDEIVDVGYGIITDDSSHNDYAGKDVEGKGVLVRRFIAVADSADTTLDRYSSITNKIITAQQNKAAGIFFITPTDQDDTLMSRGVSRVAPKDIPVIFLRRRGLEKLGLDLDSPALTNASGACDLVRIRDTGYNVIGYMPTANDTTVILGAHYDHLGWGGPTSLYSGEEKKIHYGADDNGSGSAGLLELARYFTSRQAGMKYSILFIAFSGEEAGIHGSSHFTRNWTIDSEKARMMINMDMIGRLKDQDKGLAILGTGTCPEFKTYFDSLGVEDIGHLKMAFKESGPDHLIILHSTMIASRCSCSSPVPTKITTNRPMSPIRLTWMALYLLPASSPE